MGDMYFDFIDKSKSNSFDNDISSSSIFISGIFDQEKMGAW